MNDLIWHRFVTLSAPFFQFPPPYIFFVYVAKISSKLGTMSKVCSRQIFPSSHTTYIVKRNRKDQCDIPLCNGYLWNLQNLLLELSLGNLTFLDNIPYQRNILLLTMYSHANFFPLKKRLAVCDKCVTMWHRLKGHGLKGIYLLARCLFRFTTMCNALGMCFLSKFIH